MAFSGPQEEASLELISTGGAYFAVHTADEGNTPDGTDEVSATDYSRVEIVEGDFSTSGGGPTELTISTDIVLTGAADEDWGDVTHGSVWDSETGGEPYTHTEPLGNPGTVDEGSSFTIEAGTWSITSD